MEVFHTGLVFCLAFGLLRGHLFVSIEKSGSHFWMPQMNRLWLSLIYIPEFIRLLNDLETNPGPRIVDPTKTIAAPNSQGNVKK